MGPIEALKEEHRAIKLCLRILEKVSEKLKSEEAINPKDFEDILEFIKVFADRCHHGKEEDVLFPAMEQAGIPREGGPIGVMLTEHNLGRDYVKNMSEAITEYKAGKPGATSKIVVNAEKYVDLLKQHIEKEDNILYVLADRYLSEEKKKEMLNDFERIEKERIGVGKHERFHELLLRLEETYL